MSGGGVATATRLLRAGVCSDEELGEVLAVNPCHAGNQPPARRPTAWRRAKTSGGGPPKPCSGGRCCLRAQGLHGERMVNQLVRCIWASKANCSRTISFAPCLTQPPCPPLVHPSLGSPIRPVTGVLRTLGTCTRGSRGAKNSEGACGVEALKRQARMLFGAQTHSAGDHVAGMQARAATATEPCPPSNAAATLRAPGMPGLAWQEGR